MITQTERLYPQPTLALYLGGSGIEVGDGLLTQMAELPASTRRFIEPFFIDSQEPKISIHERSRHYSYRDLHGFDEPIYKEFKKQRFPENLGADPVINSSEGCGVTRIFGTASLVACRDDFGELVVQAVSRLKEQRRDVSQPLQVFLTSSACGGTGAGMIVDAAALVRHVCRERLSENPRIFFFLLGPRVFFEDTTIKLRDEQRTRMSASTYALLKELHHFAQGHPFASSYRLRDEPIEIGNRSDDDRLFDWVYYLDGRPDEGSASRTVKEVAWTIAEAQLHLALTEVGRKVAESLPNQREQRTRDYASGFLHGDNKHRLSADERRQLEESSRKTFLAGLAVRNVRFPADAIQEWFRCRWVREALEKALERPVAAGEGEEIDRFDRILGFREKRIGPEGLLADLGLSPEAMVRELERHVGSSALPDLGPSIAFDGLVKEATSTFQAADALLAEIRDRRPAATAGAGGLGDELASALAVSRLEAARALAPDGELTRHLLRLAWHPTSGIGLAALDRLLVQAFGVLDGLARRGTPRPGTADVQERLESSRERIKRLIASHRREQAKLGARAARLVRRWLPQAGSKPGDGGKKMASRIDDLNRLRRAIEELRRLHVVASLAPRQWEDANRLLKQWREALLRPALVVAENAFTLAQNRETLARQSLTWHEGTNGNGRWRALATVQVVDGELLAEIGKGLADRVRVEDLVLAPLQGDGISRAGRRLIVESFHEIEPREVLELIHGHVADATAGLLAFLDNGWMVPAAAERLCRGVASLLDAGAEPLVAFSRSAVGLPVQGYLLCPGELALPRPFGRRVDQMTRLRSVDPLQLGVVSFAYGIPPNALDGIEDLFEQYTLHVGDQKRHRGAHDRYPMHVFRHAAVRFDEPYSPLSHAIADLPADVLLSAGRETKLFADGDRIVLDIRELPDSATWDRNVFIEFLEKLLQHLRRNPETAEKLFRDESYAHLRRLYDRRRGTAATLNERPAPSGNGHREGATR